jgi:hypothetical protein
VSDLRVIAGDPTADELGLIVALIQQRRREQRRREVRMWGRPALRAHLPGVGWWASGLPR